MKHPLAIAIARAAVQTEAARVGASVHFDAREPALGSNAWRVFASPEGRPAAVEAMRTWFERESWRTSPTGPGTFERIIVAEK